MHQPEIKYDTEPDELYAPFESIGEDEMKHENLKWESTIQATKKSVVMILTKKDLVDVLEHVKTINHSKNQAFLISC